MTPPKGEKILVILGDNITTANLTPVVKKFGEQEKGAKVLLKKVGEPERFGIAAIDEHQVINIDEKPDKPKSEYAVIGYYMYDTQVFDIIRDIEPSDRGEYEITSVNNAYIKKNQLTYDILEGEWVDAGTFESYLSANKLLMKNEKR